LELSVAILIIEKILRSGRIERFQAIPEPLADEDRAGPFRPLLLDGGKTAEPEDTADERRHEDIRLETHGPLYGRSPARANGQGQRGGDQALADTASGSASRPPELAASAANAD